MDAAQPVVELGFLRASAASRHHTNIWRLEVEYVAVGHSKAEQQLALVVDVGDWLRETVLQTCVTMSSW